MSAIQHYDPTNGPLMAQLKVEKVYKPESRYCPNGTEFTRYKPIWIGDNTYQIHQTVEPGQNPVYLLHRWNVESGESTGLLATRASSTILQQLALLYFGKKVTGSTSVTIDDSKTRTLLVSKRP